MSTFLGIVESQYGPEYFVGRHALDVQQMVVYEGIAEFVDGDYLPSDVAENIEEAMDDPGRSARDVIQLFVQGSADRDVTVIEVPRSQVSNRLAHVFTSDAEASEELHGEEANDAAERHFALDVHKHGFGILVDAQRLGDKEDRRIWIEQQGGDIVLFLHSNANEDPGLKAELASGSIEVSQID